MKVNLKNLVLVASLGAMTACGNGQQAQQDPHRLCRNALDYFKAYEAQVQRSLSPGQNIPGFRFDFRAWESPPTESEAQCLKKGIESETNYSLDYDRAADRYVAIPKKQTI